MYIKIKYVQIGVILFGLLTGCMAKKNEPLASRLLGDWTTGNVETEWGTCVLEIAFLTADDLELRMTPSNVEGERIVRKGHYKLIGNNLVSEVINKGEPVAILLKGRKLVIQIPSEPAHYYIRKKGL